jgi:hypothetical protein
MIELTDQQRLAVAEAAEWPPLVVDPATREKYVLLRAEVFGRLAGVLGEDDARAMQHLLAETDPEDWEDVSVYEGKP